MKVINFVLQSTSFTFNEKFYKQSYGIMGSPLSSIIADLVMQDPERTALESLSFSLSFYSTLMILHYQYMKKILIIY